MKMRLYLNRNQLLGFIVSAMIICALAIFSYRYFSEFIETVKWGANARNALSNIEKVRAMAFEIENAQLAFLLDGNEDHLLISLKKGKEIRSRLTELDSLVSQSDSQRERIGTLRKLLEARMSFPDTLTASEVDSVAGLSLAVADSRRLTRTIVEAVDNLEKGQTSSIREKSIQTSLRFNQVVITFFCLVLCTLIALAVLTYGINKNLKVRAITEEQLRASQQALVKTNKELESFTYSVSHDLRAPLRSLNGYAQILKEDFGAKLGPEGDRTIGVIIRNAKNMGRLIDDLLSFSKAGRVALTRSTINFQDLLKPILADLLEGEKGREISVDIKSLDRVTVDVNLFRQVWINLLSNAIKYTRIKDKALIEVGEKQQNGERIFYIKDNGAGFEMKYSNKLFGVFQRLHKDSEFEGTGVGLALVKLIIDRHDGRIWAESVVGEGTTFYFVIS